MSVPRSAAETAILIGRVVVGVIFFAHGWQKLFTFGIEGTTGAFGQMGAPVPEVTAVLATLLELLGGAALLLGLAVPITGLLLALHMASAAVIVHVGNGVFVDAGGWELVAALGSASLVLAAIGGGRFSLDAALGARWRRFLPQTAPEPATSRS